MISKPEMGVILQPLEKRFKALTTGQTEVYFDRLKYSNESVLKEAVENLVDKAKIFPTPGEVKEAVREVAYSRIKNGRDATKPQGCPQCHDGYVFYERVNHDRLAVYVGDCAYCHKGEISIQAQVVQRNNEIFNACEKYMDGGTQRYRANPDIQELYSEATPVATDQALSDRYHDR